MKNNINEVSLYFTSMRNLTLAYNTLSKQNIICKIAQSEEEIFGKCGFVIKIDKDILENCHYLINGEFTVKE